MSKFEEVILVAILLFCIVLVVSVSVRIYQMVDERKKCMQQNGLYIADRGYAICIKKDNVLDMHGEPK